MADDLSRDSRDHDVICTVKWGGRDWQPHCTCGWQGTVHRFESESEAEDEHEAHVASVCVK